MPSNEDAITALEIIAVAYYYKIGRVDIKEIGRALKENGFTQDWLDRRLHSRLTKLREDWLLDKANEEKREG